MEGSDTTNTSVLTNNSSLISSSSASPPHQSAIMVMSPCAACKILRRRCVEKCVLAPYFPPHDPLKFTTAHRVFGASNIIKFLQELPEAQRADAVSSMVYEANARLRDPVYGCAGAICQLQKQVNDLQEQLAKSQAQLLNSLCQNANLIQTLICMEMTQSPLAAISSPLIFDQQRQYSYDNFASCLSNTSFLDENSIEILSDQQSLNLDLTKSPFSRFHDNKTGV